MTRQCQLNSLVRLAGGRAKLECLMKISSLAQGGYCSAETWLGLGKNHDLIGFDWRIHQDKAFEERGSKFLGL